MASAAFEEIVEDFEFLEDWEARYAHLIDLGKGLEGLEDALKVPATKVDGCTSQVWVVPAIEGDTFGFRGDSDGLIVRGLICVLEALFNGVAVGDVAAMDARAQLARLGLDEHLSAQRSNGLTAMIARLKGMAAA
jgi:cysteine desulfuration protein SufE